MTFNEQFCLLFINCQYLTPEESPTECKIVAILSKKEKPFNNIDVKHIIHFIWIYLPITVINSSFLNVFKCPKLYQNYQFLGFWILTVPMNQVS